jgi:asparagine synthase (glutamine-hydrolysing)
VCGIAGALGIELALARPAAERMRDALRHRGPDDRGLEVVNGPPGRPPAVLAHTRLAVVDLSPAGHQPMSDVPPDGAGVTNVVTFNGEIYNYRTLGPELASAGWPCRTRCDTETILHAYRVWGVRAVERFEGMFAFCLLDRGRGLAWLCRDRIGIKPLYVYRPGGGGLLFASEVRALVAAGPELVRPRLSRGALESFFAQGAVMSDAAILHGARLLAPGQSLLCDFEGNEVRSVRYWSIAFGSPTGEVTRPADGTSASGDAAAIGEGPSRVEVVGSLADGLRRSLERLLLADVPVGLFLSGGIDSTAIAAVASEVSERPLRTLAVGFDVAELDESELAGLTAKELGTDHTRIELTAESVLASFERVLSSVDQPTVDGFNTFFIARAAREAGLTVALSGLGGDELFGGYATFRDVPRAMRARRIAGTFGKLPRELLSSAVDAMSGVSSLNRRGRALAKLAQALSGPGDIASLYFLRRELFTPRRRRALHPLPPGSHPISGIDTRELLEISAFPASTSDPYDRIAALEFSAYMRHMLLRDSDVFSMAHGLEIRVPLLEHYAAAAAARASGAWRRPDPRPKPLLVDAVGARLPPRVWQTKKRGFTFPWRAWLSGKMRERVESSLRSPRLADAGVAPAAAEAIRRGFFAGDQRVSELEVVALLVLESYLDANRLVA